MICKRCNNQMVWVGSMHGGHVTCEYCANNDDLLTEAVYRDTSGYAAGVTKSGLAKRLETVHINIDPGSPKGDEMGYMDYDI